ncbi:SDR family NAD(P)-dependent oxidoreductase [Salinirussus salinus]|uniref:SDR family NAD(P)-dependent oxidoreductase n=1 Tax=Salinirussus salinus TaxID=1198300 RepID=UPI001358FF39|nr:SDR family NAD(P)-dependent oxidoreductase [Salinirussus salinus]
MLSDTVAVVTGGTTGIGKAIAAEFLDQGAEVVVCGRREDVGAETADELGCEFVQCDVREFDEVQALVDGAVDDAGRLDVMVNNAGVGSETSLEEMSLEEWHNVIATNLDGVMHGAKAALPHLLDTEGCIINVESIYGLRGGKGATSYSASKGGVVNLTQQLAVDLAPKGVRVNGICPGFVHTPMTEDLLESDRFYEFLKTRTPMDRAAAPEEIAPLASFLASDGASYITGANIPVDGGWTAF